MKDPNSQSRSPSTAVATVLAWMLPGLGHWWIGERVRGVIFFVVISVTFWAGIAVGGVRSSITPRDNGLWIAAQLCVGPEALIALAASSRLAAEPDPARQFKAPWPASDIGVVYSGVAGLLNLLIILDALGRADAMPRTVPSRSPPRRAVR